MATKTPGRARIFTGETLRRRGLPLQVEPAAALAASGGVAYDWDLASDALSWGPNASATLGLRPHELPATGSGFHERVEPRSGQTRHEALALGETRYDLRYVLRLDDGRAISVQDAGRLISGADDRPGIVRGCLSTDPRGHNQESLPRSVQARSVLLGRLRTDIAEALRFSHGLTLVVCEIAGDELPDIADIMRLARPMLRIRDYIAPLLKLRKPSIAAIDGYCLGGGLEVAMSCDIRVATDRSRFGAPEVQRGWHAGSGNTSILPRLIGYGNAARWILTGDIFPAAEAHRVGFVQDLVPVEELFPRTMLIANRLAKNPPIAVQSAKNIIKQSQGTSIAQGLAWENDGYTLCMSTEDAAEGIRAFSEKREPVFKGR